MKIEPYRFKERKFTNIEKMATPTINKFRMNDNRTKIIHTIGTQRNVVVEKLYDRIIEAGKKFKTIKKIWCALIFQIFTHFSPNYTVCSRTIP